MTNFRRQGSWLVGRLAGILLVELLLVPSGAQAAVQGIGISPTSQDITLAPGGSTSGNLTVINDGDSPITYHVYATDYGVSGEQYTADFTITGRSDAISAVSWIKLPAKATRFTVAPHDQSTLPYTIVAPADATVGGHYASVFIETIPPPSSGATIINRVERIASIFYLTVNGDLIHSGQVDPIVAPRLVTSPPIQAALRFTNSGNVHAAADGNVVLMSLLGHQSNKTLFHGEVLPQTTRRFSFDLAPPKAIGLYQLKATTNFEGKSVTLTKWIVVVPKLTLIIITVTVVILLALLIAWLLRRRRKA